MKGGGDDDVRVKLQQSFGNIVTVVTAGGEFERRRVTTAIVYCTDSINQQCHMSRGGGVLRTGWFETAFC